MFCHSTPPRVQGGIVTTAADMAAATLIFFLSTFERTPPVSAAARCSSRELTLAAALTLAALTLAALTLAALTLAARCSSQRFSKLLHVTDARAQGDVPLALPGGRRPRGHARCPHGPRRRLPRGLHPERRAPCARPDRSRGYRGRRGDGVRGEDDDDGAARGDHEGGGAAGAGARRRPAFVRDCVLKTRKDGFDFSHTHTRFLRDDFDIILRASRSSVIEPPALLGA